MMSSRNRGFTLIELLVVIAIIGLLSSVVLGSLRSARFKAADAAIFQQSTQLRSMMELERSNTGIYTGIKNGGQGSGSGGWIRANEACSTFTGQYATKASDICRQLVSAASTGNPATGGGASATGCGQACVFFRDVNVSGQNLADRYSIMVYLPYTSSKTGAARYYCLGSSGNVATSSVGSPWTEPGCKDNP